MEGAHVFIAEEFGIEKKPLEYFLKHDRGSHVISVLVYDFLKKRSGRERCSLEVIIREMVEQKILYPGNIKRNYGAIYEEAGLGEKNPFK